MAHKGLTTMMPAIKTPNGLSIKDSIKNPFKSKIMALVAPQDGQGTPVAPSMIQTCTFIGRKSQAYPATHAAKIKV